MKKRTGGSEPGKNIGCADDGCRRLGYQLILTGVILGEAAECNEAAKSKDLRIHDL